MNFNRFIEIVKVPRMTFYTMHKMFVNFAWTCQKSAIMKECASWGVGHSIETAAKYYVSDSTKQSMSLTAHSSFRSNLQLSEDSVSHDVNCQIELSEQQEERFNTINKEVLDSKMDEFISVYSARDEQSKPTKKKVITAKPKCALVEMISKAKMEDLHVTKHGDVAERLLAHNGKNNITNRLIILRMLDILPRTWSCVKVLEENLSQYCKMFTGKIEATDEEVRKIEKKWTLKLCRILESLG